MTKRHVQRLRPDACLCVFIFSIDLEVSDPETTIEIVQFEQRCDAHGGLSDDEAYAAIVAESERVG